MKVAFFDTHHFEQKSFQEVISPEHPFTFYQAKLTPQTVELTNGFDAVCCFVNDTVDSYVIEKMKEFGVRLIAVRAAGYNNIDIRSAKKNGITVMRVPEYSPHAVAEFAVGLLLTLNRKIHKAHNRVHELNFSLEGLAGFDLYNKTVGVIGTGKIGKVFAQIMRGFGCKVLLNDITPDTQWSQSIGAKYCERDDLLKNSDIVSLHVPFTSETRHIISADSLSIMKECVFLINTGRGALIDTSALIKALKQKKIGGACLDVYEEEQGIFFSDLSDAGINDDLLARLITFPNVLITSHQAFLTCEALANIAHTTISNINDFAKGIATNTTVLPT